MEYSDNLFESGPAGRGCLDLKLHLFEQMLRGLGSLRSRSVLDVGCGDGALSGMMARRGARVVGLDKRSGRTSAVRNPTEEGSRRVRLDGHRRFYSYIAVRYRYSVLHFERDSVDTHQAISHEHTREP